MKVKDMSSKMNKVKNSELKSTVYQLAQPAPPKSLFKVSDLKFPLRPAQRDKLSKTMTTEDVMNTNQYYEDETEKGKRRWKEIRHLFLVTRKPEHNKGSLENALWYYGNNGITCNHFVHAIMDEFKFRPEKDDMEAHIRWLYWSFPGGTADNADWREILATFRIVIFYRMVQERPQDLLLAIFDIYAIGGASGKSTTAHPNDAWYIQNVITTLKTIFCLATETNFERDQMEELLNKAILSNFEHLKKDDRDEATPGIRSNNATQAVVKPKEADTFELQLALRSYDVKMVRRTFRAFMRTHTDTLVKKFQEYVIRDEE